MNQNYLILDKHNFRTKGQIFNGDAKFIILDIILKRTQKKQQL